MRIVSCAAAGADASTSAATRPTSEAGVPGLVIRSGATVGDPAPAVNVQGWGICVGDCGLLCQARGVKTHPGPTQVPVVPKEASEDLGPIPASLHSDDRTAVP